MTVNGLCRLPPVHPASINSTCFLPPTVGTIGLMGIKSPPFFTHGRMMRSLSDQVQNAPFYVDKTNKKVAIDFGNSLPIDEYGNMDTVLKGSLLVAINLDADGPMKCSDHLIKLDLVHNNVANWYRNTAGVQIFPASRSLSDDEMEKLENHPLVVAEVSINSPTRSLDSFGQHRE